MGKRLSRTKIKAAIKNSGGLITQICKATGYTWGAVRDFIAADEELTRMVEDEEGRVDDIAESQAIKAITEGDSQMVRWWLARRRRRVFGDNMDVTSGGEIIKSYVTVSPDDWQKITENNAEDRSDV